MTFAEVMCAFAVLRGHFDRRPVSDVVIGRLVQGSRQTKILVKALVDRTTGHGLFYFTSVIPVAIKPHMPFTDHTRVVTVPFK